MLTSMFLLADFSAHLHDCVGFSEPASRTSALTLPRRTALGRLGHPDGEKNLTWAGAETGTIQMIPTLASCSFDEIVDEAAPGELGANDRSGRSLHFLKRIAGQNLIMQLYVNKDHAITERIVRHAEERGVKGEVHSVTVSGSSLTPAFLYQDSSSPLMLPSLDAARRT